MLKGSKESCLDSSPKQSIMRKWNINNKIDIHMSMEMWESLVFWIATKCAKRILEVHIPQY